MTAGRVRTADCRHKEIQQWLTNIETVQDAHTERFNCIEKHLYMTRPENRE